MTERSVLLDTSFFLRLFDTSSPLHENAKSYYKYFLEHDITLKISTIAIAEFCVKGEITDLPLRNMKIIPFNFDHAQQAGKFFRIIWERKHKTDTIIIPRCVVPNDTKKFAQADIESTVESFISADSEARKIHTLLTNDLSPNFNFIDINTPCNITYGELDLEQGYQ